MKTKKIILILSLILISWIYVLAFHKPHLYTPNGTEVNYIEKEEYENMPEDAACVDTSYHPYEGPNAEFVKTSSKTYNCHAYAWRLWYGAFNNNVCWISSPEDDKYWEDGSYYEVPFEYATHVSYVGASHSAKTTENFANDSIVISKWGEGPLMKHKLGFDPYYETGYKYYKKATVVTNLICYADYMDGGEAGADVFYGGVPPYSHEWRIDELNRSWWKVIYEDSNYLELTHNLLSDLRIRNDFTIKLIVTDAIDSVRYDILYDVDLTGVPPLDVEIDGWCLEHVIYEWDNSFWALVDDDFENYLTFDWEMRVVNGTNWKDVCDDSIYSIDFHDWEELEELFPDLEVGKYVDLRVIVEDYDEVAGGDTVNLEVVEAQKKIAFKQIPKTYNLEQNYPNPFNPVTTINFQLPKASNVTLVIYNIQGQEVARLVDGNLEAGYHSVPWKPRSAASGIYIYKLQAGNFSDIKRMLYIK